MVIVSSLVLPPDCQSTERILVDCVVLPFRPSHALKFFGSRVTASIENPTKIQASDHLDGSGREHHRVDAQEGLENQEEVGACGTASLIKPLEQQCIRLLFFVDYLDVVNLHCNRQDKKNVMI